MYMYNHGFIGKKRSEDIAGAEDCRLSMYSILRLAAVTSSRET